MYNIRGWKGTRALDAYNTRAVRTGSTRNSENKNNNKNAIFLYLLYNVIHYYAAGLLFYHIPRWISSSEVVMIIIKRGGVNTHIVYAFGRVVPHTKVYIPGRSKHVYLSKYLSLPVVSLQLLELFLLPFTCPPPHTAGRVHNSDAPPLI